MRTIRLMPYYSTRINKLWNEERDGRLGEWKDGWMEGWEYMNTTQGIGCKTYINSVLCRNYRKTNTIRPPNLPTFQPSNLPSPTPLPSQQPIIIEAVEPQFILRIRGFSYNNMVQQGDPHHFRRFT